MFLIMKPSIILLIRFIVTQIFFCCGEKSKWQNPERDLSKYITIHKITQEGVIDLNSMKPKDIMMLKSNVFNELKKGHSDVLKSPYPTKHYSWILAPQKELNLTINKNKPSRYFENPSPYSQKYRDENVVNSIPITDNLQQSPEFEVINSKYMKKYSQISKSSKGIGNDQKLVSNNIKPIQKNHLMGEKYKINYGPQLNQAEKPFVDRETLEYKKKYYLNPHSDFKPKLGVLHESDKINQPRVLQENKGKIVESPKVLPMNIDRSSSYHHGPMIVENDPVQRKWAKKMFSSQKIYESALGHNSLQPENSLTFPSKQNGTKASSPILPSSDSINPISSFKTKSIPPNQQKLINSRSGDFPSMQVGVAYNQNSEVPTSFNEKSNGVKLPTNYYNGQKETDRDSDINDVIQVDIFEDFIYKPTNTSDKETRQKKDIEVTQKTATPWKTVDLVLAGFAILTVFVLVTICMFIGSRPKGMEDEDEELGCWESTRKKFVLGVGFLGVYLVTCLDFALEELDDPENPKPQRYSKMKTRKPVTTNARKGKKKNMRVTFDSDLPSSSTTHPISNTTSFPTTTTYSLSSGSSLERTPSKSSPDKEPSLPTVPSSSSPDSPVRRLSENVDTLVNPSSRGFPSVMTVPNPTPSIYRERPPSEGTVNTQSSPELPSLPTVPSTSSSDNFNGQPPTVPTPDLNDGNRNNDERHRKRPR